MSPSDIERAEELGMLPRHVGMLKSFCQGLYKRKKLLLIVRATNRGAVAQHYNNKNRSAKPLWAKNKSSEFGGKARTTEAISGGSDGERVRKSYFPDYDLQGVYELRDTAPPTYYRMFAGNYVNFQKVDAAAPSNAKVRQVAATENALITKMVDKFNQREPSAKGIASAAIGSAEKHTFIQALNAFVCGEHAHQHMFQHGAQDGFLYQGRPVLDVDEKGFLVFEPTGNMLALVSDELGTASGKLRDYYARNRISWPYVLRKNS